MASRAAAQLVKKYQRGLVVGKFSPLHHGHEMVVERALAECAQVVIISYSKPEFPGCESEKREQWLALRFPDAIRLVITDQKLRAWGGPESRWSTVPANDASEETHREFCAFLCKHFLKISVDAVYGSEDYVIPFAEHLADSFQRDGLVDHTVSGVVVDRDRLSVPISGTRLREDIHLSRNFLTPQVYRSFVRRICFLGGESSGKSTLAAAMAQHFNTTYAAEYGRELWDAKAGALEYDDLLRIAQTQIQREESQAGLAHRYLFCDTTPLTTLFYCREMFKRAPNELEELAKRAYDLTILCVPDFPFYQDGTRRDPEFQARQHAWYLEELRNRNIEYHLAEGSLEQRAKTIVNLISDTIG